MCLCVCRLLRLLRDLSSASKSFQRLLVMFHLDLHTTFAFSGYTYLKPFQKHNLSMQCFFYKQLKLKQKLSSIGSIPNYVCWRERL